MIITLTGADFSSLNISDIPLGTASFAGGTQSIVSKMRKMVFDIGRSINGGGGAYGSTVGRAASVTTVLKVNGGETVTLNQPISGITLTYALVAYSDTSGTLAASSNNNFTARSWVSGNTTLPSNAQYLLVAFKRGDGSSNFTEDECALLPSALTIA